MGRCAAGVVALAVEQTDVLPAEFGVGDLDLNLAEAAVRRAVRRRVGDEVLRAQLLLDLGEDRGEFVSRSGEEGAAPGLLGDFAQEVAAHLADLEMLVADADRVDDRVVADGELGGLVEPDLAARVVAVGQEDDRAARA